MEVNSEIALRSRVQIPSSIWDEPILFPTSFLNSFWFGLRGVALRRGTHLLLLLPLLVILSSILWSFRGVQISASRRGKGRRGSSRRNSMTTHRSPLLPPATLATPSSPTLRNRFPSSIPLSPGTNPIVPPPSAPRTPSPISPKTVINLFLLRCFPPSVAARAFHSVVVFVCRGSRERDC